LKVIIKIIGQLCDQINDIHQLTWEMTY